MRLWSRSQKIAKMITQRKTQKIAKLKLKSTSTIGCQLFVPFFASGISQPSWISQAGTSFGVFLLAQFINILSPANVCDCLNWWSYLWREFLLTESQRLWSMTTIDGHFDTFRKIFLEIFSTMQLIKYYVESRQRADEELFSVCWKH